MKRWLQKFMQAQSPEVARAVLGQTAASPLDASGLGDAALLDVGTTAGTVAAGDDARLSDRRSASAIYTTDGGGVDLLNGSIPDGSYLRRSGSDIIGDTPSAGGSDIKFADGAMQDIAVNSATYVDLVSKTLTVAAGDVIDIEVWGTVLNNSTAARTYRAQAEIVAGVNLLNCECIDGATVAASATNRAFWRLKAVFAVDSSSLSGVTLESDRGVPGAANTGQSTAGTSIRRAWRTSTSDFTGSATVEMRFRSDNATATQTFTVFGYRVTQTPQRL